MRNAIFTLLLDFHHPFERNWKPTLITLPALLVILKSWLSWLNLQHWQKMILHFCKNKCKYTLGLWYGYLDNRNNTSWPQILKLVSWFEIVLRIVLQLYFVDDIIITTVGKLVSICIGLEENPITFKHFCQIINGRINWIDLISHS